MMYNRQNVMLVMLAGPLWAHGGAHLPGMIHPHLESGHLALLLVGMAVASAVVWLRRGR